MGFFGGERDGLVLNIVQVVGDYSQGEVGGGALGINYQEKMLGGWSYVVLIYVGFLLKIGQSNGILGVGGGQMFGQVDIESQVEFFFRLIIQIFVKIGLYKEVLRLV